MKEMISDPNDLASELEQLANDKAVKYAQEQANKPIETSKHCYWCDNDTKDGRRFCDANCRDSWERFGR